MSWRPPVRAAGGSTTIMLDRYEVRWRWSQTSDHSAGDWTTYPPATAPPTTKLTETMYEITGIENDIRYDVQVQAINEAKGESLCLRVRVRSRSSWIGAGGTKLPGISPCANRSAIQAASFRSLLRPGTFRMCCALATPA